MLWNNKDVILGYHATNFLHVFITYVSPIKPTNGKSPLIKCQGAPKVCHLGALQSVPFVNNKNSRFFLLISGGTTHGKQDKNGTKRTNVFTLYTKLV